MQIDFWIVLPLFASFVLYSVWFYARDIVLEGVRAFDALMFDIAVAVYGIAIWICYFAIRFFLLV